MIPPTMTILRTASILFSLIYIVSALLAVRLAYLKGHRGDLTMPVTAIIVTIATVLLITANILVFRL